MAQLDNNYISGANELYWLTFIRINVELSIFVLDQPRFSVLIICFSVNHVFIKRKAGSNFERQFARHQRGQASFISTELVNSLRPGEVYRQVFSIRRTLLGN